jgi:hypothetical protein
MEKRQPLQQMLLGKLDIHMQKTETRYVSFTYTIINSKCIKDLNIKPETFFFFFAVLELELRDFTLSHSTSPIFLMGFSR